MNIAIIPARGGSKRIVNKNIKLFAGKPIIAWSIEAAIKSGIFDKVIVSTDCNEIASIARHYGAETPFKRPPELSDDLTATAPVIKHAIEVLLPEHPTIEFVCCLYATAPFVRSEDLKLAQEELLNTSCDYCFSATQFSFPVQRAFTINSNGQSEMLWPEHFHTRSQDLPSTYHDAGQFYWGNLKTWLSSKPFFGNLSRPHVLPHYRVQDIDTPEDWIRAESIFKNNASLELKNEL